VLHFRVTHQPGLAVTFFEGVDGGRTQIGAARGAGGTIRFTPALGSARRRQLFALLTRNGAPARIVRVGSYTPGTITPGRASHTQIKHARGAWRITWQPGALATSQQLTIHFIDGAEVLLAAKARQGTITLPRSLDRGARPTAVAIVALRGQTRGRPAAVIARLQSRRP
jgi:hypothetical protein